MPNYKKLPLERDKIEMHVGAFAKQNSLEVRSIVTDPSGKKKRVKIGKVGIDDALIDLFLVGDGTTTINHKIGRNQPLSEGLAEYLCETTNTDLFGSINFSIKGITSENIDPILEEIEGSKKDGNDEFSTEFKEDTSRKSCHIQSVEHDDSLVLTHYKTTNKLLIQGKTLYTYRRVIYLLSELLDLNGLQKVLSCTDEDTVSIVRSEVAADYLRIKLRGSYEDLPELIKKLLISGCCVKLASPTLPEYSMLLFPDLRSLEGILRETLAEYGLYIDSEKYGFGGFFTVKQDHATLDEEFRTNIEKPALIDSLEKGYTFLRNNRNELFHMSDFVEASRKIDTLDKALSLSDKVYTIIEDIYESK